ncbi:hypothetical protein Pla52n_03220 [Stieleria varia]|uniref:Uncharacterized protein n=1 Tax=Stieleria varia TaxID=2528005 RepID=A0A5C6B8W7_9BACT|nr:hypothetical protein Pla52n_03220 [Stieleria varia]
MPLAFSCVGVDGFQGKGTQGTDAFFASLSSDTNDLFVGVDVTVLQADQFAHPQSGRVHRFQDRAVPQSRDGVTRRRQQQPADFLVRQHHWQLALPTRVP